LEENKDGTIHNKAFTAERKKPRPLKSSSYVSKEMTTISTSTCDN